MRLPNVKIDEDYNERMLDMDNKTFVAGFDWCLKNCVEEFFNNLDMYYEEFEMDDCDINIGRFLDKRPNVRQVLVDALKDYVESDRNGMIVSMIEEQEND